MTLSRSIKWLPLVEVIVAEASMAGLFKFMPKANQK